MSKIKNWSRRQDLEAQTIVTKVWEHWQTGEIAWLSEEVPRDGYYFYVCPSEEDFHDNRHMNSKRYGYSHLKPYAMRTASYELRKHTEGFDHD